MDYINKADWKTAIKLIDQSFDKENEETAFRMWLTLYPNMDEDDFVNFEDYKAKLIPAKVVTKKSDEEIIKELMEIRSKFKNEEVKDIGNKLI